MPGFIPHKEGASPYDAAKYIQDKFAKFNIKWDLKGINNHYLTSLTMSKLEADKILGEIKAKYPEVGNAIKLSGYVTDPDDQFRLKIDLYQIGSIYLHDLKQKRKLYTKEATAEMLFSTRNLPKDIGRKIGEYVAKDVSNTYEKKTDTKVGLVSRAIHKKGIDAVKEKFNKKSPGKK